MRPAHNIALAADVKICKEEKCSHFIQPKDLLDGGLRNILVPSDYDVLTSVSKSFIISLMIKCSLTRKVHQPIVDFYLFIQDDPTCAELQEAMEKALQFPTAVTIKDLEAVEGDFEGILCLRK